MIVILITYVCIRLGRGGMRGGRGGRGGQKRSRGGGRSNGDGNVAKKPRLDSGSGSASGPGAAGDGGTAGVSNEGTFCFNFLSILSMLRYD